MSYTLRNVKETGSVVTGEWQLCGDHGPWLPFTYRQLKEDDWEGEWSLPIGWFYEYHVKLPRAEEDGGGVNRYGVFTLTRGEGDCWTKTYTHLHQQRTRNISKRRRQIARIIRIVFKDRLINLERAILRYRANLVDVRNVIAHYPPELIREFEHRLAHTSRQAVERMRRQMYSREVRQLEGKIEALKAKVYEQINKRRMATYRIGMDHKHKLGNRVSTSQLEAVIRYHGHPLTGVVVNEDSTIHQVRWGEISDELYLELNRPHS